MAVRFLRQNVTFDEATYIAQPSGWVGRLTNALTIDVPGSIPAWLCRDCLKIKKSVNLHNGKNPMVASTPTDGAGA